MTNPPAYIVITPVRNEAGFIQHTIASMAAQSVPARQWIVVDDGSTDGTGEIVERASRTFGWITAVRRPDRGFRKSGGGVIEAFNDGYAQIRGEWDFLVKLDGDLSFAPDYFERCLAHFMEQPRLGIAGGTVCVNDTGRQRVDSPGDPPFHVRGATKIYRRACWQQVSPLVVAPGWDTIDEVRANMHGWNTTTLGDVRLLQHRETGASDGEWRNWYKNGLANYITGYHPLFMAAKCIKRAFQKPSMAAALCAGFCSGYVKRLPMVEDADVVRYLRREQVRRLMSKPSIYSYSPGTQRVT